MKALKEIKEMMCEELNGIAKKGELSAGSLETIHKLTDTIKNIDKIEALEGGSERGSYDGGYSNRHYVRGHYSRGMSHDYSRGYSRGEPKDRLLDMLGKAMGEAETPQEKEAIERCLRQIDNE